MTTIAANRRVMAADTRVTHGNATFYASKLFVIEDSILGVAGRTSDIAKFLAWFRAGRPADAPSIAGEGDDETGLEVLALNRRGLFLYTDCCDPDPIHDKCYAIGSGSTAALAAMRYYRSPPNLAVAAAASADNATGGKIEMKHLSSLPRTPAKG